MGHDLLFALILGGKFTFWVNSSFESTQTKWSMIVILTFE